MFSARWTVVSASGHVRRMNRSNLGGSGADRRESVWAVAPENTGHSPKGIRHQTHPRAGRLFGVEGMIVVVAHAGHDQSALGTYRDPECFNQTSRSAFHRSHLRERSVNHQHASGFHPQREELVDHVTAVQSPTRRHFRMPPRLLHLLFIANALNSITSAWTKPTTATGGPTLRPSSSARGDAPRLFGRGGCAWGIRLIVLQVPKANECRHRRIQLMGLAIRRVPSPVGSGIFSPIK